MTKEDVSGPVEGDAVLGCLTRLPPHQRGVIHQVASAPMPDDCGEDPHSVKRLHLTLTHYVIYSLTVKLIIFKLGRGRDGDS